MGFGEERITRFRVGAAIGEKASLAVWVERQWWLGEALKLQAQMAGKGFEPNPKIYGAFIEGYMKLENEEMLAALTKEMSEAQKRQKEN